MSALNRQQKWDLVKLAQRAFSLAAAKARGAGDEFDSSAAAFDEWRREQVATASGKAGLRCCSQLDYKLVEAHFLNLLGETGKALNAHVRAQSEPRRQAEHLLLAALAKYGLRLTYAAALCRQIHKCELDDAPPAVLWKLIYTVNNRGRSKAKSSMLNAKVAGVSAFSLQPSSL